MFSYSIKLGLELGEVGAKCLEHKEISKKNKIKWKILVLFN
jgi:hypothetical protein